MYETQVGEENRFYYEIDTNDIDNAGIGSTMLKRFLKEHDFPDEDIRRASISCYEAEVNVVIHAGGKGCIEGYLKNNQLYVVLVDRGPGIEDIELAIQPGYTTATDEVRARGFGAGMGLDNIKTYTDKLVILSSGTGVKIEMVILAKAREDRSKEKE